MVRKVLFMCYKKTNSDFSSYVKVRTVNLLNCFEEEKINRLVFLLMIMKLASDISENYREKSDYIPLRLISDELIKEYRELESCIKKLCGGKISTDSARRKVFKLIRAQKECKDDKLYIRLMLEKEKITVRELRKIRKSVTDGEFKAVLNEISSSSKERMKKLCYLLSV